VDSYTGHGLHGIALALGTWHIQTQGFYYFKLFLFAMGRFSDRPQLAACFGVRVFATQMGLGRVKLSIPPAALNPLLIRMPPRNTVSFLC
jgi:hypothetical protein